MTKSLYNPILASIAVAIIPKTITEKKAIASV